MMRSAVEFELTYGELYIGKLEGAAPAERCTALARLKDNFGDARKRGTLQPSLDGAAKRKLVTDGRLLTPSQHVAAARGCHPQCDERRLPVRWGA